MMLFIHLAKRAGPLLKLASEFSVAYIVARLLAAISGLMLVRLLPVNEYGFYTLVLAAFTFICTFSDLGATETLSFFRWRASIKNKPWMPYFHAVMRLRRVLLVFGFISSSAYIFYVGWNLGAKPETILTSIFLMSLAAWFSIQSGIISYVLKLEQRFRQAYAVELGNESIKLMAVVLIWTLGLTTAVAGMTGIALSAIATAIIAKTLWNVNDVKPLGVKLKHKQRTSRILLHQIMPTMPGSIHYALQGILVTWLAAYYGSVVNVAEVGALGRLGVLIGILSGFTGSVYVPRLLTITDEAIFFHRYLMWWFVLGLMGGVIMLLVWTFPKELLFLLGESYSDLHGELLIVTATAVVGTWLGFSFNINRARGWVKFQPYSVPYIVVGQLLLFLVMDLSTTYALLLFALGTLLLGFTYQLALNMIGFLNNNHKR